MKKLLVLIYFVVTSLLISCTTVKNVPEDYTAPQIFQLGQKAYENQNYDGAVKYYQIAIERFGENTVTYIEAKYELGHAYLKLRKYENSYLIFKEILEFYEHDNGSLPSAYLKLTKIGMARIPEKKYAELEKKYNKNTEVSED